MKQASTRLHAAPRQPVMPSARSILWDFLRPFQADSLLTHQIVFFRRLGLLLEAGLPAGQAVGSLLETASPGRMHQALLDARRSIIEGKPLSAALARHPQLSTEPQVKLIEVGERTGRMDRMIDLIAQYLEGEQRLRRFLSQQTLYAKITFVAGAIGIPMFVAFMTGGNPLAAVLEPLKLMAVLAIVIGLGSVALRSNAPSAIRFLTGFDRLKWQLPGIGTVVQKIAFAKFGRCFGALTAAGLPLGTATEIAGRASGSKVIEYATDRIVPMINEGEPLANSFASAGVFPARAIHMLETGHESGRVQQMMQKMAEYLEDEAETRAQQVAFVFGQVFYLIVALYVSRFVLALVGIAV